MKFIIPLFTCVFITGCAVIEPPQPSQPKTVGPVKPKQQPPKNNTEFNYAHYYANIKAMAQPALINEIALVKQQTHTTAYIVKLALLHSLPNSPIRNPYSAKAALNKLNNLDVNNNKTSTNISNIAFLDLLKDLLNQQLLQLNQQHETSKSQLNTIEKQHQTINKLEAELQLLEVKIMQLKKIENNINKRG